MTDAGVALVEVLVALAVFSISMSAVVLLFFGNQTSGYNIANSRDAMGYARNGIEAVRAIRDRDWNELGDGPHGLRFNNNQWEFWETSDSRNNLTRTVTITTDIDGNKFIESKVTWIVSSTHKPQIVLNEVLSPGNEGLSGDWKKMRIVGSYDAGADGAATDVAFSKNYVYVANSASIASVADLFIFDVASHSNPILKSALNVEEGLMAVAVSGSYAYAVEENSPDFFIINITNPTAPYLVSKLTLNGGSGRTISARDSYVYVGTAANSSGPEFFVIDVTNKNAPLIAASAELNTDVNKIGILRDVAYCTTALDDKEFWLIDLADPLNPITSGSYDANNKGNGTAVHAKSDDRIYMGRAKKDSSKQIFALDASDTENIVKLAEKDSDAEDINDVLNVGTLLFVVSAKGNKELQNYYVGNSDKIDHYDDLNMTNEATGLAYSNNYLFVSSRGPKLLQVVSSKPL